MNVIRVVCFELYKLLFEGENVNVLTKAAKVYSFQQVSSPRLRSVLISDEAIFFYRFVTGNQRLVVMKICLMIQRVWVVRLQCMVQI